MGINQKCTQNRLELNSPVSLAMVNGQFPAVVEDRDQGLMPPPGNAAKLTPEQEDDIRSCRAEKDSHRNFHQVYLGNFRNGGNAGFTRKWLGARFAYRREFHDNNHTIIFNPKTDGIPDDSVIANMTYPEVLSKARFGLAPRGDNKFSYRFTEVLSAGAILVYHGDNYLFPFRPELIDWRKCAIILPEKDAGHTAMDIMNRMSARERCQRRNFCYFEIYKKYVESDTNQISGLVSGLELVTQGHRRKHKGIRCNATSIANYDCNDMRRLRR